MKIKSIQFIFIWMIAALTNALNAQIGEGRIERLDNQAFETKLIHERGVLIDLRTEAETKDGIIKGAKNAEWPGATFEKMSERMYKQEPVFLYCAGGYRSNEAAEWLLKQGFLNVKILEQGFDKWNEEGYAIHDLKGAQIRAKKEARKVHPSSDRH
jgi:rhodanese-related sulfurtransferase